MDDPTFKRWSPVQFKKLAEACAENHGAVFDYYIEKLIFHGREKIRKVVFKWIETFALHVGTATDGDIARDVARNFGLIYAAGVLGIKLKILPWTVEELLDAISKCYFATRELLPHDGVTLRSGIQALKALLRRLTPSERLGEGDYANIDGYSLVGPTFKCYRIRREAFNEAFGSLHERDLVLRWLIQKGRITLGIPKTAPAGSPIPKLQHDWPDGERVRSYEIRIPRRTRKKGESTG
jgi:hypothetical protein